MAFLEKQNWLFQKNKIGFSRKIKLAFLEIKDCYFEITKIEFSKMVFYIKFQTCPFQNNKNGMHRVRKSGSSKITGFASLE